MQQINRTTLGSGGGSMALFGGFLALVLADKQPTEIGAGATMWSVAVNLAPMLVAVGVAILVFAIALVDGDTRGS